MKYFRHSHLTALLLALCYSFAVSNPVRVEETMCSDHVTVVSRAEWGARDPKTTPVYIPVPVNMTFIHHSAGTWHGTNLSECIKQVQSIQNFHMDVRGWNDIGYSFLVCEDGRVYEGRGWNVQGAHTLGYNNIAIGICIIGNYQSRLPLPAALKATLDLLACAVEKNFLKEDYELFGHRDGSRHTSCPGDELYAYIRLWPHYSFRHIHKYGQVSSSSFSGNTEEQQQQQQQERNVIAPRDNDDNVVQRL